MEKTIDLLRLYYIDEKVTKDKEIGETLSKIFETMLNDKKSLKSIVLYLKTYYRRLELLGNVRDHK